MIDRIVFRIDDYNLEELKKRLSIDKPMSVNQETGDINKGWHLKNLSLTVSSSGTLWLKNSLHKYKQGGYNYNPFTPKEAQEVIIEIYKTLEIPLTNLIVTNIEIGVNMQMSEDPMSYINTIRYYNKKYRFCPMKPLTKTSKIKGVFCKLSEYEIKFYDKTFESTHRKNAVERFKVPANILRYEIALSAKQFFMLGFKDIKILTAEHLLNPRLYARFARILRRVFNNIKFHDIAVDFNKLSPQEVQRYIFAMSEDYASYLNYLKSNEKAYRKEIRANDNFLKKIEPLRTSKYEKELREKFETVIEEMMDQRWKLAKLKKIY